MSYLINNKGNIHDIKCSLDLMKIRDRDDWNDKIALINRSIEDEKQNRGRKTVIRMLEAKLKKLQASL